MTSQVRSTRHAFTLVEMLVVAAIIAILLSLVSAAVFRGITTARETAIGVEAKGLPQAIRTQYSTDFPPTLLSNPDVSTSQIYKFVARNWVRYDMSRLKADLDSEGIRYDTFDPGYSLAFWLVGFSKDPARPFRGHATRMNGVDLNDAFYEFEPKRLVDGHYFPALSRIYNDDNADGVWQSGETYDPKQAFLYFDATNYRGLADANVIAYQGFKPYRNLAAAPTDGTPDPHYNNDTCQVISAGLDGKLGNGGRPPAEGQSYDRDDADNIADFTNGQTMGDYSDR